MPTESLPFASITDLGRRLRLREVTAVQLAEFFLERLNRLGPEYHAVVCTTSETALKQADQADQELRVGQDRGPLHGIPFGVKDLLSTKGIPTTWGATPFETQIIDEDATVIVRLRNAGAVLCAKLAMVELAGGFGYRQANASFTGPGLNPWDKTCWSGGSSSGSGTAVGAGLVPFAIGSETMGSIVTPSCYCGVSGLRPTYGRVSRHGAMALSWTMDKIGPICRTAEDCGWVLNAIAGSDPADSTSLPEPWSFAPRPAEHRFRFAVLDFNRGQLQPEVLANYERSLEVLRTLGSIETIRLPDLPYFLVGSTIVSCEMAAAFDQFLTSDAVWKLTAPEDRWGGFSNLMIPAKDYIHALRIRGKIQREIDATLAPFDAIVTPTLNTESGSIERPFSTWAQGFVCSELSGAANVAGLPGITVPNGFGPRGLPTGIEFTGRAFDENQILSIAKAYQQQTDWHNRHPPL